MPALSSPGIGSGLDVAGIVNQLVAAEAAPTTARLDRLETKMQTRLSGLGTLKGSLSDFQSKLTTLANADKYSGRNVSNTNQSGLTASATSAAITGEYAVNVTKLAQSQTLVTNVSSPFSSPTDIVGTGSITLKFGTGPISTFSPTGSSGTFTLNIDSSNNSLEGIRKEINDADIGVRASIINNGSGYLLSLTSEHTGQDYSMEITVTDSGDGNNTDITGLSALAYNASAQNLEEKVVAQNSELTINGVLITNSTNTVNGAIEGVNLQLLDTQSGKISVSQDKLSVKQSISDLVDSYNKLISTVNDLTSYDPETRVAGVLNGDFGARTIITRVRTIMAQSIPALDGGPFTSLAGVGIRLQADGLLAIDETKLQGAIDNSFDDISTLFSSIGRPEDSLIKFLSANDQTLEGQYAVTIDTLPTKGTLSGNTSGSLTLNGNGDFVTPLIIDANNDNLMVKVDGVLSNPILLSNKSYTSPNEFAQELQSRINSDTNLNNQGVMISVAFDTGTGVFTLTSDRYGSASKVAIMSVDTNSLSTYGLSTSLLGTDGLDVVGSIGGVKATGNGQTLSGNGNAFGLSVDVLGGAIGGRGMINFSRGVANQLSLYLNDYLGSDVIGERITGIEKSVKDIDNQRETLSQRLDSLQSRLQAKFSALDALVSQLQSSGNYLTQQLDSISNITNRK